MTQNNLRRFDLKSITPRTTRYNRRRRIQNRDDSSDSSIENERRRNNYAVVANILNTMEDVSESSDSFQTISSQSNQNSPFASPVSTENENWRMQIRQQDNLMQESDSSPDPAIPAIDNRNSIGGSTDYESDDQYRNRRRGDLREQLLNEQDDEYASEDDIINYRHIFEEPIMNPNAPQNRLQEMFIDEEVQDTINARVNLTKPEILLAVLKFSLVYNLPQSAIADLFKMLNLFFCTSVLPESRYLVNKMFNFQDNVDYYALCPNCKNYVKKFDREEDHTARCDPCNIVFSLKDPTYTDFFCIINPENEIVHHLEENWSYYESVVEARVGHQNVVNDFHSGLLYKQLRNSLPEDKRDNFITAIFNSDGSPVFESSAFSIWPIQIIINELPFKVRTSKAIVCGLWFGKNKPDMNVFFYPFVTQMNLFAHEGITCNVRDIVRKIYVYAVCSCDDSVARAPMQGLTQFNGYYGCNWCLHPGYYIAVGRGGSIKYILTDDQINDRNEADTLRHMQESIESGRSVFGVINESILIRLSHFNIISGFVPDSMHLIDLGIAKQFMKYWFDTSNMPYSLTNGEVELIDNVLKDLKVPSKLIRHSRSIRDRKHWKAKELQNWVLYYSITVLLMIPRMRCYIEHWSYLVRAYYILLQNNISMEQIREADCLINRFVALTEFYYSRTAMTFNIHQLLHLTQSVINWGPLYCHSGFGFENGNGQIVKQVQAAKGVVHQICRIIGMKRSELILKKFMSQNDPESLIFEYARYLETRECAKVLKTNVGRYFGKVSRPSLRWTRELNLSDSAVVYQKVVKNECSYLSCNKVRHRSNNCFAKTIDNNFVQILFFIVDRLHEREYTVCKSVNVANIFDNDNVPNLQLKRLITVTQNLRAIDTNTIGEICVHMECDNQSYLSPVPNMYSY